jgi:hypothetical protein
MLKKPTVTEVHSVLNKHSALIVHFSGAPKGAGEEPRHFYPDDLKHVEQRNAMGGVSCSTVLPTDVFHGNQRNAFGCIGLILDLTDPRSLVAVSEFDAGSRLVNGIRIVEREVDISADDIEKTILNRPKGTHNEWVLRDFKILGVLAVWPFDIEVRCPPPIDTGLLQTSIREVLLNFPSLPIYTFHLGQIYDPINSLAATEFYEGFQTNLLSDEPQRGSEEI